MRRFILASLLASGMVFGLALSASAQWSFAGTHDETITRAVPEPAAALAFAIGLGITAVAVRRNRR